MSRYTRSVQVEGMVLCYGVSVTLLLSAAPVCRFIALGAIKRGRRMACV
jgi:hypothetical protein